MNPRDASTLRPHGPPSRSWRPPLVAGLALVLCLNSCAADLSQTRLEAIAACEALRGAECDNLVACLDGKYANQQACLDDTQAGTTAECVALVDDSPCPVASHAPALALCLKSARARTCDDFCKVSSSGKATCSMYACFTTCSIPKT